MFSGAVELKKDVKYLIILRWGSGEGGESRQDSCIEQNGAFWGFDSLPFQPIQTQAASGNNGFLCQQVKFNKPKKPEF